MNETTTVPQDCAAPYRILSLDGGGAKGFYTLGVLREIEALAGKPLCDVFDLVFGTSTGSIIGALIALGYRIDEIHQLYKDHVPAIMRAGSAAQKSAALATLSAAVFKDAGFQDVRTGVGIVATRWQLERPMIFKGDARQAHGRKASFVPGFGCTIADAVQASCSAYPFFQRKTVTVAGNNQIELIDGGYCANNPTLYAIADAIAALGRAPGELRVVSVGVGTYPSPKLPLFSPKGIINRWPSVKLIQKMFEINTQSMEQLRAVLYRNVPSARISDTFEKPEMATDLFEHDPTKLGLLFQRGGESFARHEDKIAQLIGVAP